MPEANDMAAVLVACIRDLGMDGADEARCLALIGEDGTRQFLRFLEVKRAECLETIHRMEREIELLDALRLRI